MEMAWGELVWQQSTSETPEKIVRDQVQLAPTG